MARLLVITILVAGCSFSGYEPASPDCKSPAPLLGELDPQAAGVFVNLRDGFDFEDEVTRLAGAYGFVAMTTETDAALRSFYAEIADADLPSVRCESTVASVEYAAADHPFLTAR